MKNTIKLLMTALLLVIGRAFAQNNANTHKSGDVIFEGKITDSLIKKRPNGETTFILKVSKYPFSEMDMDLVEKTDYQFTVKYNEPFKFHIVAPAKQFYAIIEYAPTQSSPDVRVDDFNWSSIDNVYILCKGDIIHAEIGKDYYKFSGRGSAKLNCESEIYKNGYRFTDDEQGFYSANTNRNFTSTVNRKMDSCLIIQKAIVKRYEGKIGKELSEILLANCYGIRYYWELRGLRQISRTDPGLHDAVINSPFYKNIDFSRNKEINPNILVQAPVYVDFLFEKIKMDNFLSKDGILQLPISVKKTFNTIIHDYQGIVRDKLLSLFFTNYLKLATSADYLDEGINLCGPSIYKDILVNIKETRSKGLPFYPFDLPDTKGNRVKLNTLNNKVVIVDFWYTGCENCINLHYAMSAIHHKFKDNPHVAFVSISIDKNQEEWIKSVSTGRYTNPDDINLYTEGQESRHPLLKKYLIESFPTVFVLKNGKIFSSNPPIPNGTSTNNEGTKEYIGLIESALADHSF